MRLPFTRASNLFPSRVEPEIKAAMPVEVKAEATLTAPATLANPDPALYELFGIEPSLTGESFAAEMAMKCTASRAAVLAISETLGALPVHTFALAADGTRQRDREHPADTFLNVAACP